MVPRLQPAGKSFKGLAQYLTHDPGAGTTNRVAWTHTLNCAYDHVPSAVDEMVTTWRDAALLKEEAGVRRGGRTLEAPVKHVSLNWHPSERPTRDDMIAASELFLTHMGWQDHQAVLVAHTDKPHAHVHIMLNAVHPETGRKLDDGLEKRRAQAWAEAWELEHCVFCPQRLRPAEEREPSPPRWLWEELGAFDAHRDRSEADHRARRRDGQEEAPIPGSAAMAWRQLKELQRREREAFFRQGRQVFGELRRAAYREVREAYRGEWGDFYAARRQETSDAANLYTWRSALLARQKAELTERREAACAGLRATRDKAYAELLGQQREDRQDLRERQARGEPSRDLLDRVRERVARGASAANQNERDTVSEPVGGDGEAEGSTEGTGVGSHGQEHRDDVQPASGLLQERHMRDGVDIVSRVGLGVVGSLATFGERLFEGLFGRAAPRRRGPHAPAIRPVPPPANDAGEMARRTAEAEAEVARRRAAWWEDRQREQARD